MSKRALVVLLGLSVLFNACFVLGWIGASSTATADASNRLATSLDLNDAQRHRLDEMQQSLRSETGAIRAHVAQLRQSLAASLEAKSPDLQHVRTLVAEISSQQREAQTIAADHLGTFLDMLSPEQRRAFGRRLGRGPRHLPPPHVLEQYDADEDGEVNEHELATAMDDIRTRHAEMRERRQALAEQFDADGDGRLDETERAALREQLLEEGLMSPHHADRERGPGDGHRRGPRRGRGQGRNGEGPPPDGPGPPPPDPGQGPPPAG